MLITKTSILTGRSNTLDLNVTNEQLEQWGRGGLIQNVMPHLSEEEREFLISGILPQEWAELIGPEVSE